MKISVFVYSDTTVEIHPFRPNHEGGRDGKWKRQNIKDQRLQKCD